MQVRQDAVHQPQEAAACQKAHHRRQPARLTVFLRHVNGRCQQGPETGGDHHPGGKPQHGIQHAPLNALEEEHHCGAERGYSPGEQGA